MAKAKKKAKKKIERKKLTAINGATLEKRDTVLFTRVTPSLKSFVIQHACRKGVSEATLVNHILTWYEMDGQHLDDLLSTAR